MFQQKPKSVALITGASRGIGSYLAVELWDIADVIVICARNQHGLSSTASAIQAKGGVVHCCSVDLCDPNSRKKLLNIIDNLGVLDVVIHNAGTEYAMAFEDQSREQIDQQLNLNLTVPIDLTHEILPGMRQRKFGKIAFVSSMSGKTPTPYNAVYSASKYGLNGFVASLAFELSGSGIHVGVVCPSFVADSGMWADTGLTAPALMKEVSLSKVCQAVRNVLEGGSSEELVTPLPVRPLLALYAIFPWLGPWLLRRMGVVDVLQQRRQVVEKKHLR